MNWPFSRPAISLLLGLLLCFVAPSVPAQQVESAYGPLPVFEFHSGFWVNLHHFLYHEARARADAKARGNPPPKPTGPVMKQGPDTGVTLSPTEQKAWDEAIAYYNANYTNKDMQVNIDLILLNNQLGDFEDCNELLGKKKRACDAGLPGNIGVILEAAAPIYRAHWWADHDRSNRRWVVRMAPLVREQGVGLSERLADIYQAKWPKEKIRVEVCAFANAAGAYTTLDPLRVTIASTDSRNQGPEALEVVFLEASHDIARPVEDAISRECKQRDKPIPRDLWHALILYTTGEVISPVMEDPSPESSSTDASTDASTDGTLRKFKTNGITTELRTKFTQRGWNEYLLVITMYWQPYLDGHVSFEDAIAHLVSAV
jgi:hypothetical protein